MNNQLFKSITITILFCFIGILWSQDWVDQARSTGNSVEQQSTAKDEDGTYKTLINWEKGFLEFSASATTDMSKMVNEGQAISQAKETARYLAYAKAVEFIDGVLLTREVELLKSIMKTDEISASVRGSVKNSIILNEDFKWEREIRTGQLYPWATVKLGVLLYGGKPDQNLIKALFPKMEKATKVAGFSKYDPPEKKISKVIADYPNLTDEYTGLIIDTRGFQASPSMFPNVIVQGTKQQLFGALKVDHNYAKEHGITGYAVDVELAKNDDRVLKNGKSNCYVLTAVDVTGENNIIISKKDAAIVAAIDKLNNLINECHVMIVVDK
ncbi:MAG: hypothetical protein H8D23_35900 [Candidatus Brocadiales bacterium]|nr:hypothetical protein [Candidatus Brocadiales bacterium]